MIKKQEISTVRPLILIAEDNAGNYMLLETLLQKDYLLLHAVNGREAVWLFAEHHPALILMDIKMPEMNGYEATEAIRIHSPSVPIIGVTAYAFPEDQQQILSSGFNDYLVKPINFKELKEKVRRWLDAPSSISAF